MRHNPSAAPMCEKRDQLTELLSRKVLDIVEALPRFQGGPIANFQRIREYQRERADIAYERRKGLKGESVSLRTFSFAGFYEFEQFSTLNGSLGRLFNGAKFEKQIKEIQSSEERLDGASWSDLGSILRTKPKFPFTNFTYDERLPAAIDRISISHHRILPSLAALEIQCWVSSDFVEKHARLAETRYLPTLTSSSLNPKRFLRGYSISGETEFEERLDAHIEQACTAVKEWLEKVLGGVANCLTYTSIYPWYCLSLLKNNESLSAALSSRKNWLRPYGFSDVPFDLYMSVSDRTAFCLGSRRKSDNFGVIFSEGNSDQQTGIVTCALRGIVTPLVLSAMITQCRNEIESLRSKGFNEVMSHGSKMLQSGKTIQSFKFANLRVKRFEFEITNSQHWIQHSMDQAGIMETVHNDQKSTFKNDYYSGLKNRVKTIVESSDLLDKAMSERLQIESILAMHNLQRGALALTVVGLLVAVVGLVSSWDDLTNLMCELVQGIMRLST
jgi:hypothetical protein